LADARASARISATTCPRTASPEYDAGKKIKGKKRHILVDTQGLAMHAIPHTADMQDRDGGALVTAPLFGIFPFLLKLYADGGYDRSILRRTLKKAMSELNVEIVKRSDMPSRYVPARNCHRSAATVMVSAGLHFQKASDNRRVVRLAPMRHWRGQYPSSDSDPP
jgi:hypothetical protein